MTLRPYQVEAVDALWSNLDRHVCISMPTGSGKSHVIGELCRRALEYPDTRVLVITHTKELVEQDREKIQAAIPGIDVTVYCAGLGEKRIGTVTVASVQSIHRIREVMPAFDLIIVDEAHRIPHGEVGQYRDLFKAQPNARIVGLTATPYRLRGGLLCEGDDAIFDDIVHEVKTADLIKQGHLSRIVARATSDHADTSGLHIRAGEFKSDEMAIAFDHEALTAAAVSDMVSMASNRKAIMVFCCNILHCDKVAAEIRKHGERSIAVVTGDTPSTERDEVIDGFRSGRIRILVNCNVLTTGFDAPNVDCIVLLRATVSPGLYVQMIGRGLRICEGKNDCLLLDYGENVLRHGPIDSITIDSIDNGEGAPVQKTCPQCKAIILAGLRECPECGHLFEIEKKSFQSVNTKASNADPISGTVINKYPVSKVRYYPHKKQGKPACIRVEYQVGMASFFNEYICPEHNDYSRQKATQWLARRGITFGAGDRRKAYYDAWDAISMLENNAINPKTITVKTGGKWPEVINYEF